VGERKAKEAEHDRADPRNGPVQGEGHPGSLSLGRRG
jgi:hypothetical protein